MKQLPRQDFKYSYQRCNRRQQPSISGLITKKRSMSTFILPGPGTMYLLYPPLVEPVHKSQVHCSGVMQWWACSSLMAAPLPARAATCQTCKRIVLLLVFIV